MRYDLTGKTALVTGASSGIGREIAKGLALMGARVILHGRDKARLREAWAELNTLEDGAPHVMLQADFQSLEAVRALADEVSTHSNKLDILINNAGLWTKERKTSQDGYELQFQVNHLAPFLLTQKLHSLLQAAGTARLVNIASAMHLRAQLDLNDLMYEKRRFSGLKAYAQSKLAMVAVTRSWAEKWPSSSITVNAAHPGIVRTNIANHAGWQSFIFNAFGLFYQTPRKGARTPLFLAAEPTLEGVSGRYFRDYEMSAVHPIVEDAAMRAKIWEVSEKLIKQALD